MNVYTHIQTNGKWEHEVTTPVKVYMN